MLRLGGGVLLVIVSGYAGCANTANDVHTSPQLDAVNNATGTELRLTMRQLWRHIRALDNALVEPVETPRVVAILDRLREGAATLQTGPGDINHPILQNQLGEFQQQLARSRIAALADPPDYRPALAVIDGCARCHTLHR